MAKGNNKSNDSGLNSETHLWAAADKMLGHLRIHAALSSLFRTLPHELMTAHLRVHNLDVGSMIGN